MDTTRKTVGARRTPTKVVRRENTNPIFFCFFFFLLFGNTGSAVQQIRVGALSPMPSCLGISGHPSGSRQGHPRYTGARSALRPWVARTQFSTADHSVRNTTNMVAEQCRSRARALATRALLTRVCCVTEDPETKKSMRRSMRTSMRKSKKHQGAHLDVKRKQDHV